MSGSTKFTPVLPNLDMKILNIDPDVKNIRVRYESTKQPIPYTLIYEQYEYIYHKLFNKTNNPNNSINYNKVDLFTSTHDTEWFKSHFRILSDWYTGFNSVGTFTDLFETTTIRLNRNDITLPGSSLQYKLFIVFFIL